MHGASYEEIMLARNDRGLFFLSAFAGNKIVDFLNSHASNRIFCASRKMRNYLIIEKGISSEKIIYLPNGVDLNFFKNVMNSDTRRIKERIGKKFLFGYIGGLQKYQGLESFIQAAEKILESDIAFLVVGAQHSYKKNNIHFFTKVPYSKIVNYYALCDAFILPRPSHISLEIAAPTKFSEYCAMGKPILTTNVGDPADLVKRYKCGIVIKDNQPNTIEEGILELKSKSRDELFKMGKQARRLAEDEFDWNKIVNNLLSEINNIS
jgi:glycosyltransferase involved in cell wall biosynthesis